MGLGPCVCQHCQVLASFSEDPIPVVRNASTRTVSKWTHWYCEFCGETDPNDYAGFGNYDKYKENERVLRFLLNKKENKMTQ